MIDLTVVREQNTCTSKSCNEYACYSKVDQVYLASKIGTRSNSGKNSVRTANDRPLKNRNVTRERDKPSFKPVSRNGLLWAWVFFYKRLQFFDTCNF